MAPGGEAITPEVAVAVRVPIEEDHEMIDGEALLKLGLPSKASMRAVPVPMVLCMKDHFKVPDNLGLDSLASVDHVSMSLDGGGSCSCWNPFRAADRTIWVHPVRGGLPQSDVVVSYIQTKGGALLCRRQGEEVIGTLDKQWRNMVNDRGNVLCRVKDGDEGLLPAPAPGTRTFTVLDEQNQPHWILSGPGGQVPFKIHHVTLPSVPVGMMRNLEIVFPSAADTISKGRLLAAYWLLADHFVPNKGTQLMDSPSTNPSSDQLWEVCGDEAAVVVV